jgi:hypothetical protein
MPTGFSANDCVIFALGVEINNATISTPSGWTLIRRQNWVAGSQPITLATFLKIVGAGESAPSWTTTSSRVVMGSAAFAGVDTTNPLDNGSVAGTEGLNTTPVFPSITTLTNNAWVMNVVAGATGGGAYSVGPPSGNTEEFEEKFADAWWANIEMSDFIQAVAGATGTKTGSSTLAASQLPQTFALRPDTVAPAAPTGLTGNVISG